MAVWVGAAVLYIVATWVVLNRMLVNMPARIQLEREDDGEVDAETGKMAAAFEACGFRHLAVYRPRLGEVRFTLIVMGGPGGASWAEVTDRLWEVASPFGSRLARTSSRSMLPSPGSTLGQCVPGAAPEAIVAEHGRALALLAREGLEPDRLADEEIVGRFEAETRAEQVFLRRSRWRTALDLAWRRPLRRHRGRPALAEDPCADWRIRAWRRATG